MDNILHLAGWAITLFGGATALENTLENFVMDKAPSWLKPLVAPILSLVFAVVANLYGGMPMDQALQGALALWGSTVFVHNHPTLTSAELPPPPPDLPPVG